LEGEEVQGLRNNILARYVAAILVVLSLSIPTIAQNGAANIQIKNFGRINEHYYRGGQPEGRDYADLAALGVKSVINLIGDEVQANEQSMVEKNGMHYFYIPMTTHKEPTTAQIAQFLSIVNDPVNQPVYVHCVGGKHRTGVMTAVYRMNQDKWNADKAFEEMKQYKFGATFLHSEFKNFVYAYYSQLSKTPDVTAPAATAAAAVAAQH
jgi:protein tyrosine/serine phosphatase